MKIALIVPQYDLVSKEKLELYGWEGMREYNARKKLWSTPHLGLLTVAGMLPKDIEITYYDLNSQKYINDNCDWAFLSPSTSQAVQAYELADLLRGQNIKIMMGGVHVSILPDEALHHADTVIIGEAELVMEDFISDMLRGTTRRVYESNVKPRLYETPVPRYDLVRHHSYASFPMQISRGCPHQCSFCISSKMYGKKVRRKKIRQVAAEIESILNYRKKPVLFFTDDNLLIDEKFSIEFLNLLQSYHVRWYGFSDAGIGFKNHMLERLYESGCMQLLIGFESLKEENLSQLNQSNWKKNKRKNYETIISNIQSYGIGVVGSFVIGLGNEDQEYFNILFQFIMNTNIYATNITMLTPFPGTKVFEMMKQQNKITTYDWRRYNGFELTFKPEALSAKELEEHYIDLNKKINSSERTGRLTNYFLDIFKKDRNNHINYRKEK